MPALKAGHYHRSACPICIRVTCPTAACCQRGSPEGTGGEAGMHSQTGASSCCQREGGCFRWKVELMPEGTRMREVGKLQCCLWRWNFCHLCLPPRFYSVCSVIPSSQGNLYIPTDTTSPRDRQTLQLSCSLAHHLHTPENLQSLLPSPRALVKSPWPLSLLMAAKLSFTCMVRMLCLTWKGGNHKFYCKTLVVRFYLKYCVKLWLPIGERRFTFGERPHKMLRENMLYGWKSWAIFKAGRWQNGSLYLCEELNWTPGREQLCESKNSVGRHRNDPPMDSYGLETRQKFITSSNRRF